MMRAWRVGHNADNVLGTRRVCRACASAASASGDPGALLRVPGWPRSVRVLDRGHLLDRHRTRGWRARDLLPGDLSEPLESLGRRSALWWSEHLELFLDERNCSPQIQR